MDEPCEGCMCQTSIQSFLPALICLSLAAAVARRQIALAHAY